MVLGIPDAYLGLLVGLLAVILWIITNIHLVRTGRGIKTDIDSKRAETEQFVKDELQTLQEGIDVKIETIQVDEGGFERALNDFEARFSEAYKTDMKAIEAEMEKIPLRVSGMIHGQSGVEEKAFRRMAEAAEVEVEGEISVMEATMAQDPRAMQVAIAQKIQKLGNDPEWQEAHPIGAILLEISKPQLMGWIQTAAAQMQGTPRLGPGNTTARKQFSSPYG